MDGSSWSVRTNNAFVLAQDLCLSPSSMATADETAAIWALLVQILQEPAGTSVDLLARLANAFPGRETVIAGIINNFLQG